MFLLACFFTQSLRMSNFEIFDTVSCNHDTWIMNLRSRHLLCVHTPLFLVLLSYVRCSQHVVHIPLVQWFLTFFDAFLPFLNLELFISLLWNSYFSPVTVCSCFFSVIFSVIDWNVFEMTKKITSFLSECLKI